MKYIPDDIPKHNLETLGEGSFFYVGTGPEDAVRMIVATNNGENSWIVPTWENLKRSLNKPLNGEIHFSITNVKEEIAGQKYQVYVKYFLKPNF